jgi:hypothetical protein
MPTIYTEDAVGKAVEDHFSGSNGVPINTPAGQLGYAEFQAKQGSAVPTLPDSGPDAPPTQSCLNCP